MGAATDSLIKSKLLTGAMHICIDFLAMLTPGELRELLNGNLRVSLLRADNSVTETQSSAEDGSESIGTLAISPEQVRSTLLKLETHTQGMEYLKGLGLTAPAFKQLAMAMGIDIKGKAKADEVKRLVIETYIDHGTVPEVTRTAAMV